MRFIMVLAAGLLMVAGAGAEGVKYSGQWMSLYEFGSDEMAYLALPSDAPKGGVLVIPDARADREILRLRADVIARLGHVVLVVDLYGGRQAVDEREAAVLEERLSAAHAQKVIIAGMRLLGTSPRYRPGPVVVAAWGDHLVSAGRILLEGHAQMPVRGAVWVEPGAVRNNSWPVETLLIAPVSDRALMSESLAANVRMELLDAPSGFMGRDDNDPAAVRGWIALIEFCTGIESVAGVVPRNPAGGGEAAEVAEPSSLQPNRPRPPRHNR